jgi:hypothetical protein
MNLNGGLFEGEGKGEATREYDAGEEDQRTL